MTFRFIVSLMLFSLLALRLPLCWSQSLPGADGDSRTPLSAKPVKEPTAKSGSAKRSLLNRYVGSILKRPPLSAG